MSYTNTVNLGIDHKEWFSSLDFYDGELKILKERLSDIAMKNSGLDARAGIEHFQNQFIIQKNNIDELRHAAKETNHHVYEDSKEHGGHVDNARIVEFKKISEEIRSFEKIFNELRKEFNSFLAKWM